MTFRNSWQNRDWDTGFERRGWRPGSDYYGNAPHKYGVHTGSPYPAAGYASEDYRGELPRYGLPGDQRRAGGRRGRNAILAERANGDYSNGRA